MDKVLKKCFKKLYKLANDVLIEEEKAAYVDILNELEEQIEYSSLYSYDYFVCECVEPKEIKLTYPFKQIIEYICNYSYSKNYLKDFIRSV